MNSKQKIELQKYFSRQRLESYLPNKSVSKQFQLYRKNIKLCKMFYTKLHYFEIILRNAIDSVLTTYVNGADWINILPLDKDSLHKITEVKNRLSKQNKQITHDRIISELTLGFWTTLFSKRYTQCKFQSFLVKRVFKDCPKKQRNIKNIQIYINDIRDLRNRVCHYEKIIHFSDINQKYKNIQICISWISKDLCKII
jgi:hypothetical protein